MPGEEITLNISPESANMIRVRLIDIAKEAKIYNDNREEEEFKEIRLTDNLRNGTDRKNSYDMVNNVANRNSSKHNIDHSY